MRNDLIPEGAELLALSLISRGAFTAPGALVAYHVPKREIHPYIVHVINLRSASKSNGGYYSTAADALEDFSGRLALDIRARVTKSVPLTEPIWLTDWEAAVAAEAERKAHPEPA